MSTTLPAVSSAPALQAGEAHAIAVDAYLYFYPLITMDLTRKQSTNMLMPGVRQRPDEYVRERAGLSARGFQRGRALKLRYPLFHRVARSHQRSRWSFPRRTRPGDIISCRCSTCGPTSSHLPVGGRPALSRPTSSSHRLAGAGRFPSGFTQISAPTPYVWIIGRTRTDGPADYDAVHKIQAGYTSHAALTLGQDTRTGDGEDRPSRRYEDAAYGAGGHYVCWQLISPMQPSCSSSTHRTSPISRSSPR